MSRVTLRQAIAVLPEDGSARRPGQLRRPWPSESSRV